MAESPPPSLHVLSSIVVPGSSVGVQVQNAPGNDLDRVELYELEAPAGQYLARQLLHGATSVTLSFTAPDVGAYEFRLFEAVTDALLATSEPFSTGSGPGGGGPP